jgi:PhoPQ-activated pathogenicity-related protein
MSNWGYYSEQIGDYSRRNLLSVQDDSVSSEENALRASLWQLIDPYFYRSRVTIPKLLIHGTNDRYWNLDATKFYWDDLVGPKYILTLPNADHDLGSEMLKGVMTIAAFAKLISNGDTLPTMTWKMETGGNNYTLTVTSDIPAMGAKLWVAHNEGRDFREAKWTSTRLEPLPSGEGNFLATIAKPKTGYVGFYVEIETEYEGIACSLTTQVFNP